MPHRSLLMKLNGYGVEGKILVLLHEYLSNHIQCVLVNGSKSGYANVISEIPQGNVI